METFDGQIIANTPISSESRQPKDILFHSQDILEACIHRTPCVSLREGRPARPKSDDVATRRTLTPIPEFTLP